MIRSLGIVAVAIAAFAGSAESLGADAGTARRTSELKQAPYRDAAAKGVLEKGSRVEILEKRGGWYRVRGDGREGWVRMLGIQRGQARKGGVDARGVVALATGRAGTGRVVSTTGIRGLSEAELRLARYDEGELAKLDAYAVNRAEAESFARQGGLKAREVP